MNMCKVSLHKKNRQFLLSVFFFMSVHRHTAVNEIIARVGEAPDPQKLFLPFPFCLVLRLLNFFVLFKKVSGEGTAAAVPTGAIGRYVIESRSSVPEGRSHTRSLNKALTAEKIFRFFPEERALNK